jgi:hypothetical protein
MIFATICWFHPATFRRGKICACPSISTERRRYQTVAQRAEAIDTATSPTKKLPTVHATLQSPNKNRAARTTRKSAVIVNGSSLYCKSASHPSLMISPRNFSSPNPGRCHRSSLSRRSLFVLAGVHVLRFRCCMYYLSTHR